MTKVGIVGVMGACLALTSCAKVATPPPTHDVKNESDSASTVSISETVDFEVPPCKGTDICDICGAGGDCGSCPLCNPNACAPEVCETCIDVFKVPEIAELKVEGRKGPLIIATAQSIMSDTGVESLQQFNTDTLSVCIYEGDKIDEIDASMSVAAESIADIGAAGSIVEKSSSAENIRYSVGSTKYFYNGDSKLLAVSQDGYTYEMLWQDEQGYYDASLYAAIISNEQYGLRETGCPLSEGIRVDSAGDADA